MVVVVVVMLLAAGVGVVVVYCLRASTLLHHTSAAYKLDEIGVVFSGQKHDFLQAAAGVVSRVVRFSFGNLLSSSGEGIN